MLTEHLYYHDSFLYNFEARVLESVELEGRTAVVLDRTAFYPTSGGQVHDTGKLVLEDAAEIAVTEVAEDEEGKIFHFISAPVVEQQSIRGLIDSARRRDHMQQHSGQHVLSAAFIRLFDAPTVSFHMGTESCTIDLVVKGLSDVQAAEAEKLANEVVTEDRRVSIRFVSMEEARQLNLRKLPPKQTGQLRLIDITDFDLTPCGGTHVQSTGQIGAILLRKGEAGRTSGICLRAAGRDPCAPGLRDADQSCRIFFQPHPRSARADSKVNSGTEGLRQGPT